MKDRILASLAIALVVLGLFQITFKITPAVAEGSTILVPSQYSTIQAAIDAASPGDTVYVYNGTYDEQVVINKTLTLQGEGDTTIVKPSLAGKLATILDGHWWGGTKQIAGIIVANVSAGSNVTVKNLKVDGENVTAKPMGADYVAGIFYRETGGSIDTITVANMTVGATGTTVRGYCIYLSAIVNAVSVEVKGCILTNYDKNGIDAHGNKLTVDIHDNTVTGRGPLPSGDEVQNGILIMDGAVGTVNYNIISNIEYTPETWWACGILFLESNGSAEGNSITNCQAGIATQANIAGTWAVTFLENSVGGSTSAGINVATYNAGASITATITRNQLTGGPGDGIYIGDIPEYDPAGSIIAIISNNTISSWQHGIHLVSSVSSGSNITGNTITNNDNTGSGIHIERAINAANIRVNYNNIMGNIDHGVFNNGTNTLYALFNWWGNGTGPYHPATNPSGTGDDVSDNVEYKPWLIKPYPPAIPAPELHVDSVTVEGPSYGKTFTTNVTFVNVTNLYGFDFKLYWNTTLLDLVNVNLNLPWPSYYPGKNETNEDLGRYWIAVSALNETIPSFNGSIRLAVLTFKVTYMPMYPENVSCPFDLNETILGDPDGKSIPHIVYDGEYRCCAVKAKIQVLPQVSEAKALNQVFNISITVANMANLYTFEFTLQYNTTQLDAKEIAIASFPGRTYKVSKKMIDDTQGLVTLRIENISSPLQVNESLVLANVTFEVTYAVLWLNTPLESDFSFGNTTLIRDTGVVPHDKIKGSYRYRPIQGDMDSDGEVTIIDLAIVARAYGTKPGDPKWNELADLNHDNIINILDLIPVARNYGRTS